MNVYELLTISQLEGMQLIAGESGKEREAQSVNMMNAPDIIPFLKENEFLITTAPPLNPLKNQKKRSAFNICRLITSFFLFFK